MQGYADTSKGDYGNPWPRDSIDFLPLEKIENRFDDLDCRQRSLSPSMEPAWARIRTPSPTFCRHGLDIEPPRMPLALNDYLFPSGGQRWADVRDDCEEILGPKTQEKPTPPSPPLAPSKERSIAAAAEDSVKQTVSRGSVGHPYSCAEACKYAMKARGCKDAADCNRCHLCTWKKSDRKKALQAAQGVAEEVLAGN